MKRFPALLAFSFFAVIFGQRALASSIYYQTEGLPPFGGGGIYSEASGSTTVYDNFTLPGDSTITHLSWVGVSTIDIGPSTPGDYFQVNVYDDQSGVPGSLVSSNAFHIGGLPYAGLPNFYAYDAPLTLHVTGGQQYWLSIFTYGTSSQWSWDKGFGGDGHSLVFDNPSGSGSFLYPHDAAFTLQYDLDSAIPQPLVSSVPEPSALVLSGFGFLSLAGIIRKRRRA